MFNVDNASVYVELGVEDLSKSDLGLLAFSYQGHEWLLSVEREKARKQYEARTR